MKNKRNVIKERYSTNKDTEIEGAWLDIAPTNDDGSDMCRIRLARMGGGNKKVEKAYETKFRQYRLGRNSQIDTDDIPERVRLPLLRELYAETMVNEWENVYDDDGKPMKLTRENVIKVFVDNPDLFLECMVFASNRKNYQDSTEEDAKN